MTNPNPLAQSLLSGGLPLLAAAVADLRDFLRELSPDLLPHAEWVRGLGEMAAEARALQKHGPGRLVAGQCSRCGELECLPVCAKCCDDLNTEAAHPAPTSSPSDDKPESTQAAFARDLDIVLAQLRELLIAKNKAYGDSALNPINILSKADARTQILSRIDDKLKRHMKGESAGEDVAADLRGYFILLGLYDLRQGRKRKEPTEDKPACADWCDGCRKERHGMKAPHTPRDLPHETARHFAETTEENCTTRLPYSDPLCAFREVTRWRDMQARTYEDGSALLERFKALEAQHAEAQAELTRLKAEARRLGDGWDLERTEVLRLKAKTAHDNLTAKEWCELWTETRANATRIERELTAERKEVARLKAAFETEERERLKLLRYYGNAPDSAESVNPEVVALKAENAQLQGQCAELKKATRDWGDLFDKKKELLTEAERTIAGLRQKLEDARRLMMVGSRDEISQFGEALSALDQAQPEATGVVMSITPGAMDAMDAASDEQNRRMAAAYDEPEATGEREIVVGSVWKNNAYGHLRTVTRASRAEVFFSEPCGYSDQWDRALFMTKHTWVSNPADPEPVAGEVKL